MCVQENHNEVLGFLPKTEFLTELLTAIHHFMMTLKKYGALELKYRSPIDLALYPEKIRDEINDFETVENPCFGIEQLEIHRTE